MDTDKTPGSLKVSVVKIGTVRNTLYMFSIEPDTVPDSLCIFSMETDTVPDSL